MPMTKPPCYNRETQTDCPRRYVGCKASCPDWHKYLAAHEEEKEKIRRKKNEHNAAVGFLSEQGKRNRLTWQERYEERKRQR